MDLETLAKRLEWLDEERRKDKDALARLQQQLETLSTELTHTRERAENLEAEIARLNGVLGRFDQLAGEIDVVRQEVRRQTDSLSRQTDERLNALESARQTEVERLHRLITDLRTDLTGLARLKTTLEAQGEEDARLARMVAALQQQFDEVARVAEEVNRARQLMEEERSQDSRRLTDLIGQVTALRKRLEEVRSRGDLTAETLNRLEQRVNELILAESERRERQTDYMERQALQDAERQRTWALWEQRFTIMEQQSREMENRLQSLSLLERDVRQAQEMLTQATERFERRINEITEMHRLMEERTRQEWVNFRAEDQKRWANYMLTQQEQQNEATRQVDRLREQQAHLEELLEEMRDFVQALDAQLGRQLQTLLSLVREWATEHERISGTLG